MDVQVLGGHLHHPEALFDRRGQQPMGDVILDVAYGFFHLTALRLREAIQADSTISPHAPVESLDELGDLIARTGRRRRRAVVGGGTGHGTKSHRWWRAAVEAGAWTVQWCRGIEASHSGHAKVIVHTQKVVVRRWLRSGWGRGAKSRTSAPATWRHSAGGGGGRTRSLGRVGSESLTHQVLDLSHLILPPLAPQVAQECGIDGVGALCVAHLNVGFGGFLAELQQLIRFFLRQHVQVDPVYRLIEEMRRVFDVALGAGALTKRVVAGERVVRVVEE